MSIVPTETNGSRLANFLAHRPARAGAPVRSAGPVALAMPPSFLAAVASKAKVCDTPHNLYKYPARFAPEFAREAIAAFSKPGDTVLDVFMGGGTALTEAVALGRTAIGFDISALATFLARTKTTPLTVHDERALVRWSEALHPHLGSSALTNWEKVDTDDGYYRRNLPPSALGFLANIIAQLAKLRQSRQRRFARLVLLSVGQWALDCKTHLPSDAAMLAEFQRQLVAHVRNFRAYTWRTAKQLGVPHRALQKRRTIVHASSERCGDPGRGPKKKATLIVTSPPYPGVHMLYHRWQLFGRRETPAPFLIANCRDGDGISFYSLGNRHELGLKTYYDRLTAIFAAARKCITDDALVVQMVAFNQPNWQLPAFLAAMEQAGYTQVQPELPPELQVDGNLWRAVPGRRWYAANKKSNAAGKEVVLFHRPTRG